MISGAKNESISPERYARDAEGYFAERRGAGLHPLPGAAGRVPGPGLRRSAGQDAGAVQHRARGAGAVPGSLPVPDGGRVPGHQRGPVRAGAAAREEAPQRLHRRRRGPVDLRLAQGRRPQSPALRARLPGAEDRAAGAELPLHAGRPGRGERRHQPERGPQAEDALDREPARPAGSAARGVRRARRGAVRGAADRAAAAGRPPLRRRGGHLPHQRPVPRAGRCLRAVRRAVQAGRRDAVLPAPRGQGRAGVPAADRQPGRWPELRAGGQRAGARHRAEDGQRPAASGRRG